MCFYSDIVDKCNNSRCHNSITVAPQLTIYIYIHICVCMRVCMYIKQKILLPLSPDREILIFSRRTNAIIYNLLATNTH